MKVRQGFVSNSSSSSFVLDLRKLDAFTLLRAIDVKRIREAADGDMWTVAFKDHYMIADTMMDNFDFKHYLLEHGVTEDAFVMDYNSEDSCEEEALHPIFTAWLLERYNNED